MATVVPSHVDSPRDGIGGIFGFMNYNVQGGGPITEVRRHILRRMYNEEFSVQTGSPNARYVDEFGTPASIERFEKMVRFFQGNLNRFGNRSTPAWIECIEKWEEDHDWFIETFGNEHGFSLVHESPEER